MASRLNRGCVAYAEAIIHHRAGRGRDAAQAVAAGDDDLRLLPLRWHYARRVLAEAAIAGGWGEPVTWLREAMTGFEADGRTALVRSCRDLLRRAGAPVPRRGRGDSAVPPALRAVGVTSRELDVLKLVGEGLSNRAIAERLHVSPRTVETHVAHLLARTSTASRAALADFANSVLERA
jgi:DNA-binding CsgD family transcriptional regulator